VKWPAVLIAGAILTLATPAVGSAAQTLDVSVVGSGALPGFYTVSAVVPGGWTADYCTGSVNGNSPNDLYFYGGTGTLSTSVQWYSTVSSVSVTCFLSRWVTVYSDVLKTHTVWRTGTNTTSRARSGKCGFKGFGWNGYSALELACWGTSSVYAKASWRLYLPADAQNVLASTPGVTVCCKPGTVTRGWTNNGDGSWTYRVKVTGRRGYDVKYVALQYQTLEEVGTLTYQTDTATGSWPAS
jgi:hypothetical protein